MRDCFFQRRWPDGWSHKESGIEVGIYQHLVDQDGLGGIGDLFRPRGAASHRCERERQQPGFEDERQLQAVDRTVIAERSRRGVVVDRAVAGPLRSWSPGRSLPQSRDAGAHDSS